MTGRKTQLPREQRRALFQKMVADLQAEADELRARLEEIEQELAEYGLRSQRARTPGAGRTTAKTRIREGSLKAMILQVLDKKGKTATGVTKAVHAVGYKTKSKAPVSSVSIACGQLV